MPAMSSYRRATDEFYRRERRQPRGPNRMMLVGLGVFALAAVILLSVVGRPYLYLRDASAFMDRMDDLTPVEVKRQLTEIARGLQDRNTMVRHAAVAAMRVATRKDLGNNPEVWRVWWRQNRETWEYQPSAAEPKSK